MSKSVAVIVVLLVALVAITPVVGHDSALALPNTTGFTEGAACKVTKGDHTGKTGKYDADGWCCFSSGGKDICVECTGNRCEDARGAGPATSLLDVIAADQQRVLAGQQATAKLLGDIVVRLDNLEIKLGDVQTACGPADLFPVAQPGSFPPNYCQTDGNGNLVVVIKNQGLADAPPSTLRVTFSTPSGPVPVDVPTPMLSGSGGFIPLALPIPPECFLPNNPFPNACNFMIAADVTGVVIESDESNNNVAGACVPVL